MFQELVSWIWWLSVVSTLFYVVFFAVGPGSIPWMITAELFSQVGDDDGGGHDDQYDDFDDADMDAGDDFVLIISGLIFSVLW